MTPGVRLGVAILVATLAYVLIFLDREDREDDPRS